MPPKLQVVSNTDRCELDQVLSPEEDLRQLQRMMDAMLREAQLTWADIWHELMGTVTNGSIILAEAEKGVKPKCGWAEFLEKLWLLKHYLDYTRSLAAGGR